MGTMPPNLLLIHGGEEQIRSQSIEAANWEEDLLLHLNATEAAMSVLYAFRLLETEDQDTKALQLLGTRAFTAFAAATKLMFAGYYIFAGQMLRDILETIFLVDLFRSDPSAIERWRFGAERKKTEEFRPVNVRKALDARDGNTAQKRAELYKMFSTFAGHPSMESQAMLKPKGTDLITAGPFFDESSLLASISEIGRLAVQIGETYIEFGRNGNREFTFNFLPIATAFNEIKKTWVATYYPNTSRKDPTTQANL